MPNPSGTNAFQKDPAYGDVKKQTQLSREAPISGAPLVARAVNTPRRDQRHAIGSDSGTAATPEAGSSLQSALPPATYQAQIAAVWAELAAHPEASPLVREYAAEAQQ